MTARLLTIALPLALALPGDIAWAQRSHPGGRGGGRPSGGHAVTRSGAPAGRYSPAGARPGTSGRSYAPRGPVGSVRGGAAPYRHPRAGTGSGGYGYYRPYYGGHHGPSYGYGYRPYYPYYGGSYYRPYYRPYVYGSIYWGWPYYSGWYDTPYATGPYYAGSREVVVYGSGAGTSESGAYIEREAGAPVRAVQGPAGQLRLEVRPNDASVYVDDVFRGSARDARILDLAPGLHRVEIVRPGYAVERHEVRILEDERTDLLVELREP